MPESSTQNSRVAPYWELAGLNWGKKRFFNTGKFFTKKSAPGNPSGPLKFKLFFKTLE